MFTTLFKKVKIFGFSRKRYLQKRKENSFQHEQGASKKYISQYFRLKWAIIIVGIGYGHYTLGLSTDICLSVKKTTWNGVHGCACMDASVKTVSGIAGTGTNAGQLKLTEVGEAQICIKQNDCYVPNVGQKITTGAIVLKNSQYNNAGIEYYTCQWDGTQFTNATEYTWVVPQVDVTSLPLTPNTASPIPTHTLTIETPDNGMVADHRGWIGCGSSNYKCSEKYDEGLDVRLTATPLSGYQFESWTGDCSGTENKYRFTIENNTTCSATFSKIPEPVRPVVTTQPTSETTQPQTNSEQPTTGNNEEKIGVYSLGSSNNGNYHSIVRTTNVSPDTITVTMTLYSDNGVVLGNAILTLQPQESLDLTTDVLKQQLNITDWNSNAWLEFTTQAGTLKVDFSLTNPDGTVTDLTKTRKNAVYNIPSKGNAYGDALYLQFSNTSDQTLTDITGTLYDRDGKVVGNVKSLLLPQIAPKAMQFLTSEMIEQRVGSSWQGRGWLQLDPEQPDIELLALFQGKSGSYFNMTSISGDNTLNGLPGSISTEQAFIRIVNTSDQAVQITGTLSNSTGQILGQAILANNLPAKAIRGLRMQGLERLMGIPPQTDKLELTIISPTTGIALAGNIRSAKGNISNASVD